MSKKVSVIIPYYKKIDFLKKSINSILNQTYKNIEILLIYDDNDKGELNKIKKLIKNRKIKLFINNKNIGAGRSRNIGLKHSVGYYISFLDADDIWKKINFLLKLNLWKKIILILLIQII